jgi:hypothetical protein
METLVLELLVIASLDESTTIVAFAGRNREIGREADH